MQLVSERCEVLQAWSGLLGLSDTPFREQRSLLSGRIHCQTCTLSDQPRVMCCEASLVCIFACSDECHFIVVDEVVEEFGDEFGEPPHADEVASAGVVGPLPAALLALVTLFLVVVAVQLDDLAGDLFVNHAIQVQAVVLSKLLNHERLISLHDR